MFKFVLHQLVEVIATGEIAVVKGREERVNCENRYIVSFLSKEKENVSDDDERSIEFEENQLSVVEDEDHPGTPIFMVNYDPHNPPEEES